MRPCSAIQPFTDETTTTEPPPAGDHVRQAGLGAEHGAEEVVLELLAPLVHAHAQDSADAGARRVEDEARGWRPQLPVVGEDVVPRSRVGHVADDGMEPRMGGQRLIGWRGGDADDGRALGQEAAGAGLADALGGSGDDGHSRLHVVDLRVTP